MCCCGLNCILPIIGTLKFISQPRLIKYAVIPYAVLVVLSVVLTFLLFYFLYGPVVAMMPAIPWKIADELMAVFVILALVLMLLFFAAHLLFDKALEKITNEALQEEGVLQLLSSKYGVDELPNLKYGEVSKACVKLSMNIVKLILMLVSLPLNGFPVFGTILWLCVNGWLYAWDLTVDLLPIFGADSVSSQMKFCWENKYAYITFGAVALALTLIPIAGPLFFFINAYGAALLFQERLNYGLPVKTSDAYTALDS